MISRRFIRQDMMMMMTLTSSISQKSRFGQGVRLGFLQCLRQSMYLNSSARMYETLLQILLLISILTKPLLPLSSLQDDVNISSDQSRDLFSLRGLDTVVLVLIVSEV